MTIHTDRLATALDRHAPDSTDRLEGAPSRAVVRRVLDNDRRREVLRCLFAANDPIDISTLVARIADAEHAVDKIVSRLEDLGLLE